MGPLFRFVRGAALAGFLVGVLCAGWTLSTQKFVREFQAGEGSPAAERAVAIVQRSAFEGLGFGGLALVLGLVAFGAARCRRAGGPGDPGESFASSLLVVVATFAVWTWATWITDAALPFLGATGLVLLHAGGFLATLVALGTAVWIATRAPGTPRDSPAAATAGALVALGLAGWLATETLLAGGGAHRVPRNWAVALGGGLVLVGLSGLAGRLLRAPVGVVSRRLAAGSLVPRAVSRVGLGLLAGCVVASVATLELSAVPADASYATLEPPAGAAGAGGGRSNVLLVTIDTLRADHLGCYGYERPTSPFIDSLAAEGTVFADAAAAAAWTKPATGTILTGLFPSRHGALYHGSSLRLPEGERTLAEAFRDAGYVTAGFVSNPNVKRVFDFDRGFDEYFDSPVEDTVTLAAVRDSLFGVIVKRITRYQFNWKYENDIRQMNRHVLAWLDANRANPFFLYVHYIDPHIPYTPPSEYEAEFAQDHGLALFQERKRRVGIDRYDGEIRYTDDGIRDLFEHLESLGIADDTVIALTSDHGEEFYEHEVLGHGFSLYQPVIHVPLVARGPGIAKGRVVEVPVQILDLPASLLDVAGTGVDALGDGRSFAPAMTDPDWAPRGDLYLENEFGEGQDSNRDFVLTAIRDGRFKLILTDRNLYRPVRGGRYDAQELYDLEADPEEATNLVHDPAYRDRVEAMLKRLREHSVFLDETGFRDIAPAALSPEMEAELRNLGYLGDE